MKARAVHQNMLIDTVKAQSNYKMRNTESEANYVHGKTKKNRYLRFQVGLSDKKK